MLNVLLVLVNRQQGLMLEPHLQFVRDKLYEVHVLRFAEPFLDDSLSRVDPAIAPRLAVPAFPHDHA